MTLRMCYRCNVWKNIPHISECNGYFLSDKVTHGRIFINDTTDCLDCIEVNPTSCSIFSDNLNIYCSYDFVHNNPSLVNTIENIDMWSCQWQLKINPDRAYYCTLVIIFGIGLNIPFVARSFYLQWYRPRLGNSVRWQFMFLWIHQRYCR